MSSAVEKSIARARIKRCAFHPAFCPVRLKNYKKKLAIFRAWARFVGVPQWR